MKYKQVNMHVMYKGDSLWVNHLRSDASNLRIQKVKDFPSTYGFVDEDG